MATFYYYPWSVVHGKHFNQIFDAVANQPKHILFFLPLSIIPSLPLYLLRNASRDTYIDKYDDHAHTNPPSTQIQSIVQKCRVKMAPLISITRRAVHSAQLAERVEKRQHPIIKVTKQAVAIFIFSPAKWLRFRPPLLQDNTQDNKYTSVYLHNCSNITAGLIHVVRSYCK